MTVLLVALTTLLSTAVGGVVALRSKDRLHLVLGFSAGILLGVVAFDLLPEVFELSDRTVAGVPAVMLTFIGGFLLLHVIERAVAMHAAHEGEYETHSHHSPQVGLLSALALVAHSFMDGLGIGLAFSVSTETGIVVAVAVIGHDFADGLNTVSVMLRHGSSTKRAVVLLVADALAPVAGAASTLLFSVGDATLGLYLGFFAGFLLYLATADILPEAHARHPSRLTLVMTLLGIAAMFAIVALSGH